jgi:hypothetical protein
MKDYFLQNHPLYNKAEVTAWFDKGGRFCTLRKILGTVIDLPEIGFLDLQNLAAAAAAITEHDVETGGAGADEMTGRDGRSTGDGIANDDQNTAALNSAPAAAAAADVAPVAATADELPSCEFADGAACGAGEDGGRTRGEMEDHADMEDVSDCIVTVPNDLCVPQRWAMS